MTDEINKEIEKVHRFIRNDNGDEMIELCNQLASEISMKTSFALEVKRLKQVREIERKTRTSEHEAMQNEIGRLRKLVELSKTKL